jgi:hypothetical protein
LLLHPACAAARLTVSVAVLELLLLHRGRLPGHARLPAGLDLRSTTPLAPTASGIDIRRRCAKNQEHRHAEHK